MQSLVMFADMLLTRFQRKFKLVPKRAGVGGEYASGSVTGIYRIKNGFAAYNREALTVHGHSVELGRQNLERTILLFLKPFASSRNLNPRDSITWYQY